MQTVEKLGNLTSNQQLEWLSHMPTNKAQRSS